MNLVRIAQIGTGAVALAGGYFAGQSIIKAAWREDLTGAPSRIIDMSDTWIVDQPREPQAKSLTSIMTIGGAVVAGAGAMLATRNPVSATGALALATGLTGAALFGAGAGSIAGALATTKKFDGADVRPNR